MNIIFKKLNYKNQPVILAINPPESFTMHLNEMKQWCQVSTNITDVIETEFAIVFVTSQQQIDEIVPLLAPKLKGDAVVWFCYPKGSSKRYKCDFNRDTGWSIMGQFNLEGVRQVAIDEDWSALRFRNVKYIKTITRRESMALSQVAKDRTTKKGE